MRIRQKTRLTALAMFLLGLSVSEAALKHAVSRVFFRVRVHPMCVHGNDLHRLETEGGLNDNRQDRYESVATDVVDEPSTGYSTRVLPISEPYSLLVRATSEGDDKTGDDKSNHQRD